MAPRKNQNEACRTFGQAIRSRRVELGISQEELASRAGLHRTYIADIERGVRNIGLLNIIRLAEALGILPSQLFSYYEADKNR